MPETAGGQSSLQASGGAQEGRSGAGTASREGGNREGVDRVAPQCASNDRGALTDPGPPSAASDGGSGQSGEGSRDGGPDVARTPSLAEARVEGVTGASASRGASASSRARRLASAARDARSPPGVEGPAHEVGAPLSESGGSSSRSREALAKGEEPQRGSVTVS